MRWTNYFSKILVINLRHRTDRLLQIYEEMDKMDINFELVTAIEHENGAEGLRQTLNNILQRGIEEKWENVLIFEDDCEWVENKDVVDRAMDGAIKEIPDNWHLLYLSAQVTCGFHYKHGNHLLQLDGAYSTHSWAISKQGMKEIISQGLDAPIDNCMVDKIQKMQNCYITYPILTTQRAGESDIGKTYINWFPFLVTRYNTELSKL